MPQVFIPEWNRWIHCDPCENTCDKPLMYEQGWKKKLSLIVAASAEEVVDVTWRYSVDRQGVGERRNVMFEERWLEETLKNLNNTLSIAVVPQRKVSWSNFTRPIPIHHVNNCKIDLYYHQTTIFVSFVEWIKYRAVCLGVARSSLWSGRSEIQISGWSNRTRSVAQRLATTAAFIRKKLLCCLLARWRGDGSCKFVTFFVVTQRV